MWLSPFLSPLISASTCLEEEAKIPWDSIINLKAVPVMEEQSAHCPPTFTKLTYLAFIIIVTKPLIFVS